MDYKIIFSDLDKIKIILSKLFNSELNSNIKEIFQKMDNTMLKNVVETQYLYMYSKLLNILKNNKSLKILTLEENLFKIKEKNINDKIDFLNTLGYQDLLLVLLNIQPKILEEISNVFKKNNNIDLKINNIDLNKINFSSIDTFVDKISSNILSKLNSNININFNQSKETDTNIYNNNTKKEPEKLLDTREIEKQEEIIMPDNMPTFEDIFDDEETDDEETNDEEIDKETLKKNKVNNAIIKDMKKKSNNIINEYEQEQVDSNNKVSKVKKILNNNDIKLIDLLNN
tara:strand:+ start:1760 stop:2617 length:858 start_codon:yes stop_codon:yes gene_type:complete